LQVTNFGSQKTKATHQTSKTASRELSYDSPLNGREKPRARYWTPGSVPWFTSPCSSAVKGTTLGREDVKMGGGTELLKPAWRLQGKVTGLQTQDSIGPRIRIKQDKW